MRMKTRAGVTFTEMIMVVGIMGAVIVVTVAGVNFFNNMLVSRTKIEMQREAQTVLYDVVRAARNSRAIIGVSSTTLIMNVFNTKDNDHNSGALVTAPLSTATYHYDLNTHTLKKTVEHTHPTTLAKRIDKAQYLVNMLKEPTEADPIFKGYDNNRYVEVIFRMKDIFKKHKAVTYRAYSMRRTRTGG